MSETGGSRSVSPTAADFRQPPCILSNSTCFGVSALSRFERDALSQPGVRTVILLEGINDIGFAGMPDSGCSDPNNPDVTAAQIEAGYQTFITEAHAKGVKIYAGTLSAVLSGTTTGWPQSIED